MLYEELFTAAVTIPLAHQRNTQSTRMQKRPMNARHLDIDDVLFHRVIVFW
jgi:hypothetical protein